MTNPRPEPPAEIVGLARERSEARAARDWLRADALRAEIEAAGWKVIDRGTDVVLEPATPTTIEEGGVRPLRRSRRRAIRSSTSRRRPASPSS